MDQDQTDDFEMKPLTAGLGFHKRSVSLKEHVANSGLVQQNLRRSLPVPPADEMLEKPKARTSKEIIAELHKALEPKPAQKQASAASQVRLSETLPREMNDMPHMSNEIEMPRNRNKSPFDKIGFQMPDKTVTNDTGVRRGAHDGLVRPLVPISVSFAALLLDATIVMAVALIFLVSLVTVTGVNLNSVIHSARIEFAAQLSLLVMYFAVFEMYMVVGRSFYGRTVGEWTFDLQMGNDELIKKSYYPALVLWRSMLNLLTGIVVMPFISLVIGRDFAARFTGLQLYRKNT
jgi:uncharacterized RDD family membrane protein YckC